MKRGLIFLLALAVFAPLGAEQVVRLGNVICNAGTTLTVPLEVAGVTNAASVCAQITYDPLVLVLTKAEPGSLKTNFVEFVVSEQAGSVTVLTFGTNNVAQLNGTLAQLTFTVRPGSEGLYSDLALAKVSVNEKTMTADLTVGNPLVPRRGMLRAYATDATPVRTEGEGAVTVAAGTTLKSLTLQEGDALQVASADQAPVIVTDTLTASCAVKVMAPSSGWATARYDILKSRLDDLELTVVGSTNAVIRTTREGDYTLYSVETRIERLLQILKEGALTLNADQENRLIGLLKLNEGIAGRLRVKGTQDAVDLGLDLGIEPTTTEDADGVPVANFELPTIQIVGFDPSAGTVRAKIIPPKGARIANKDMITTGVIHVYGTNSLTEKMRKIGDITLNLDDYMKSGAEGEVTLGVQFGEHTFFKVVAGRATTETIDAVAR